MITVALAALLGSILPAVGTAQPAEAAPTVGFDPGNIIDDSVFWNPNTMTPDSIQAFLDSKVPYCKSTTTPCLKDYRQDTYTIAGTPMCDTYPGAPSESAATIIYKVAQTCGINPQALIVMLQKEQGLVTSTAPSSRNYRSAMGAGCPDTADCDAAYYGFFDQVQYAGYLLRRYTQPPGTGAGTAYTSRFDRSYPVGAWSNIQYSPNAACGTKPVYVANQATHALYVYTPYTPNDAALRVRYGTGDSCSAYGNRNFYDYFTDWFGSTKGSDLVRSASNPDVYLITANGRYRVPSLEVLNLLRPLGSAQTVAQNYLDRFPIKGEASSLVRDDSTGAVYFVGGGKRFYLRSCEQIAYFGADCGGSTSLTSAQVARFADGGEVGNFVQSVGSPTVYVLDGGGKRPVVDWESYQALADVRGGGVIATLAPSMIDRLATGAPAVGPARLVKSAGSPEVWFIDGLSGKRHLSSFDISRDIGSGDAVQTVSQATLDAYGTQPELNSALVRCGPDFFIGSGGALWSSGTASGYGASTLTLDAATCSALPKADGRTGADAMAVQGSGATVYLVQQGVRRPFASWAAYTDWASATGGVIVTGMSSTTLGSWAPGARIYAVGSLVQAGGDAKVYLVDGGSRLTWLRSFAVAENLGFSTELQTSANLAGYTASGDLGSPIVTCGTATYVADGGRLAPTSALAGSGLLAAALDPATCARPAPAAATGDKLFVKASGSSTVYYIEGGKRRAVASWSTLVGLAGSADPRIVAWSASLISPIPSGPAV